MHACMHACTYSEIQALTRTIPHKNNTDIQTKHSTLNVTLPRPTPPACALSLSTNTPVQLGGAVPQFPRMAAFCSHPQVRGGISEKAVRSRDRLNVFFLPRRRPGHKEDHNTKRTRRGPGHKEDQNTERRQLFGGVTRTQGLASIV